MTEAEIIQRLAAGFRRSSAQVNKPFECDAELIRIGSEVWALTTDDFSPVEDGCGGADPGLSGWNVAVATLSDLLAAGAEPRFFLQVLCVPPTVEDRFLEAFSSGVREALDAAGCCLLGGDIGLAETWRYVGTALGPVPGARALQRRLPDSETSLWLTGPVGAANVAAALGRPPPRFVLRHKEAALIRDLATTCIDTSGAFLEAVWDLHQVSPGIQVEIELEKIPYAPGVRPATASLGVAPEATLLGGAGEYELLFAVPRAQNQETLVQLRETGAREVGRTVPAAGAGTVTLRRGGTVVHRMDGPPPCPRAASDRNAYMAEILELAAHWFGAARPASRGREARADH